MSQGLTGRALEDFGNQVFGKMGLNCIHRLNNFRLLEMDPTGPYRADEHAEFDYLILYGNLCLVGEITSRGGPNNTERKYQRFRRHFDLLRGQPLNDAFWTLLGVPNDKLAEFREVQELKAFFITTDLQEFDVSITSVPGVACIYEKDWELLVEYSECIGSYAIYPFVQIFGDISEVARRPILIQRSPHGLIRSANKRIASGEIANADIYTFEASPYELLDAARVYRRDMLPYLSSESKHMYQRPLIAKKLEEIRNKLLSDRNFMFPNSILVVLSSECMYSREQGSLQIPNTYGAVHVEGNSSFCEAAMEVFGGRA